jgi:3',5'-cyclic AMP phosphodiesterase CpdA
MTDIHIMPERNAEAGFAKAIEAVNQEKPEFVITGGDLIYDALKVRYPRADSLYHIYNRLIREVDAPVYNTIGNHEHFAVSRLSGDDTLHPEAGSKMFENRIGRTFQAFTHKGWKFFLLNSVMVDSARHYYGSIDPAQMEWIRKELSETDTTMPIIISTHIPFRTVFNQVTERAAAANDSAGVILNANEVLDLFAHHNLKLVLQGHQHYYEEIFVGKTWFVTGGSVAAAWWKGEYYGVSNGYLVVKTEKDRVSWEYRTYGWEIAR